MSYSAFQNFYIQILLASSRSCANTTRGFTYDAVTNYIQSRQTNRTFLLHKLTSKAL